MSPTTKEVGAALKGLGAYRVRRVQQEAKVGSPDGISGALLLGMGCRESWLQNIVGGLKRTDTGWVPLDASMPSDAARMDVGWLQISRMWNPTALEAMPAVKSGTWGPVVYRQSPLYGLYVPQFATALRFTIDALREARYEALDEGASNAEAAQIAIAAHNAGVGGALKGWREGDIDKYTAMGDYSEWVLEARTKVNTWLHTHPTWRVA